ncbi:MAG: hypothetical protein ACYDGM_13235 [Vulcanimicrobiaceae bacterium]
MLATLLLVLAIVGIALGLYAWKAPRRIPEQPAARGEREPLNATTGWTSEAGDDFAGLSEGARCDLVFAVAAFDDERSNRLLEHALDDPAEAVATAAAHALASTDRRAAVDRYLEAHPGERAQRIAGVIALLE